MLHSFNTEIAKKYGVDEAIFLNNIHFWTIQNIANRHNYKEGHYWTYNSQRAFSELFPYWNRQSIRRIINNCISKGLLIEGLFNKKSYDHTKWYALTSICLDLFGTTLPSDNTENLCIPHECSLVGFNQSISENTENHWLDPTNHVVETNQPIPDSKQQIVNKRDRPAENDNFEIFKTWAKHNEVPCPKIASPKVITRLNIALNLFENEDVTLFDYLSFISSRCRWLIDPYVVNGKTRQNDFYVLMRPINIKKVISGEHEDKS